MTIILILRDNKNQKNKKKVHKIRWSRLNNNRVYLNQSWVWGVVTTVLRIITW